MKKIVIIGATSGLGREVAKLYIAQGWQVGIAGRRTEILESLQKEAPQQVKAETIDVTQEDSPSRLLSLIKKVGGMDVLLLSSGIGKQNPQLEADMELRTAATNVEGFMRIITTAYHFFEKQGYGHIAAISSIAGTKGLGIAPAYSATKCFQNTYIDALDQLAHMNGLNIGFTDIRPGFVATPLLKDDNYPLLMKAPDVAAQIVRGIARKKRTLIIDWKFRIIVFFWRLIPRCIWLRLKCVKTN